MSNFLKLLIENEKNYLKKLDLIDSVLSPLWMKQFISVAPDFTELLKCIQDIIYANKSFYEKLMKVDSRINFDDILLDLIQIIQLPYKSYTEHFINNLNQRQDILCTPSIHQFLIDINSNKDEDQKITLESLFCTPLHQLDFYKSLFNRSNIESNKFIKAQKLLNALMIKNSLPAVDLDQYFDQLDISQVVDVLDESPVQHYTLPTLSKVLLSDTFICPDMSKKIRLVLTVDDLVFCSIQEQDALLYAPVPVDQISIRTIHTDRELIGEYHLQFWIQKQKLLTMKATSKEIRNTWLGLDPQCSIKDQTVTSWSPLMEIVDKYDIRRSSLSKFKSDLPKPIRTKDIFTISSNPTDEISPLESSDESDNEDTNSWFEDKNKPSSSLDSSLDIHPRDLNRNTPYNKPNTESHYSPIATQSLTSLNKPPIVTTPERPSHIRSLSAHEPSSPKKSSFMRSVMSAVSNRASFKPPKNLSASNSSGTSINSLSDDNNQHLVPPSFTSSQSSLNLTPPLSRSSSPGMIQTEDLGSPPGSPGNQTQSILYSNEQCHVFHWKDRSWYAAEEICRVEVRQTWNQHTCLRVQMQHGQLYLNAWILPDTFIRRTNETDLSLHLNNQTSLETYLIHFETPQEADKLQNVLEHIHQEIVTRQPSVVSIQDPVLTPEELAKTVKLVMQCKCKLFVQSASSKWSSLGSVSMKISQHFSTKKMHIAMESKKGGTQLVSAMIQSNHVERLNSKRISFLFIDEKEKNSVVYMIQVREEATGDKILEYAKTKNAENGW